MKICIIAEGSYPYVAGGVSSWTQSLINKMPQHQFIIYTIGAEASQRGIFKYDLPPNILHIEENFLDEYKELNAAWGKKYHLDDDVKCQLGNLISGVDVVWEPIFEFVTSSKYDNVASFLMSRDFFEIVARVSEERYQHVSFTEMFWTVRSMLLPLMQIIKKGMPQADLYHSVSTGYAGLMGSVSKYLYHKPYIITEHGIYCREREEEIIKAEWLKGYFKDTFISFFNNLSRCAYDAADRVVTLFERNKEIEIEMGCQPEKIEIIPNGIDLSLFNNLPARQSDGYINLGALIRIVPIKDIKTMIQGFALAKREVNNLRLYIMGPTDENPDYYDECMQLVESLKIPDVIFTGSIQTMDYIHRMDIVVLTSISEGQPFAILEAMASKKPCITTNVGCCRELLLGPNDNFGEAGVVIPIMDYDRFSKAITRLAKSQDLRQRMGENGYERVTNTYSISRFVDEYTNLYSEFEGIN